MKGVFAYFIICLYLIANQPAQSQTIGSEVAIPQSSDSQAQSTTQAESDIQIKADNTALHYNPQDLQIPKDYTEDSKETTSQTPQVSSPLQEPPKKSKSLSTISLNISSFVITCLFMYCPHIIASLRPTHQKTYPLR